MAAKLGIVLLVGVFLAPAISVNAFAHARLVNSAPVAGSTITASPGEVRIKFSEGVEPALSTIAVSSAAGASVQTEKPALDPSDKTVLVAKLVKPLEPGVYKVRWRAVASDTHKTQGEFSFDVRP
jgi:methionine-rich copper-binding protein CopC